MFPAERMAVGRVAVAALAGLWWLIPMHMQPSTFLGLPMTLVAGLLLVWTAGAAIVAAVRPEPYARRPLIAVGVDFVVVLVWLAAMGTHAQIFDAIAILAVVSAATRLSLLPTVVVTVAYTLLVLVLGGPGSPLTAGYTLLIGLGMSTFATRAARDRLHALEDPLTGVFSRRWGMVRLKELIAGDEFPFCVGLVDIDQFKAINDTYGHPVGDHVLTALASHMQANLRGGDAVVRMGGDEFLLILTHTSLTGAEVVAERLRTVLAQTRIVMPERDERVAATASIGLAEARAGMGVDELIAVADHCLYEAKRHRNKVVAVRAG